MPRHGVGVAICMLAPGPFSAAVLEAKPFRCDVGGAAWQNTQPSGPMLVAKLRTILSSAHASIHSAYSIRSMLAAHTPRSWLVGAPIRRAHILRPRPPVSLLPVHHHLE
jgi:hypothetical protein